LAGGVLVGFGVFLAVPGIRLSAVLTEGGWGIAVDVGKSRHVVVAWNGSAAFRAGYQSHGSARWAPLLLILGVGDGHAGNLVAVLANLHRVIPALIFFLRL
jgi:hypothetical protein